MDYPFADLTIKCTELGIEQEPYSAIPFSCLQQRAPTAKTTKYTCLLNAYTKVTVAKLTKQKPALLWNLYLKY
jgi:hypothetical protein